HHRHRDSLGRRLATPPVKQSAKTKLFVALPPTPHLPVADTDNLGRLPPRDLLGQSSQNHFLYYHRPLHRGPAVRHHAAHDLLPSPPVKRTHHLLSQRDISCANNIEHYVLLTESLKPATLIVFRVYDREPVRKEHAC